MSHWVCTYCIATRGIKGSDLKDWPAMDDEEAQCRHIESEHHIPVRRDGETVQECKERFSREQPDAGGPNCKCPSCQRDARYGIVDQIRSTVNG